MPQGTNSRSDLVSPPSWSASSGAAHSLGRTLFLVACSALGVAELASFAPLPQLQVFDRAQAPLTALTGVSLAGLAPLCLCLRGRWCAAAAAGLAGSWFVTLFFGLWAAAKHPLEMLGWVPPSKAALFALAALANADFRRGVDDGAIAIPLRLTFGLIMTFYALVHFVHGDLIVALIPRWLPERDAWPWVTGSALAICGVALVAGRLRRQAALAIALMFASWIILLHVERVVEAPASIFEWSFALSALALLGVALTVASQRDWPSRSTARPKARL